MPTVIPFVPPSQMSCFNITFPGDTEYEFHEALKMTIDTSSSGLNPGTIAEADVVITDDDSKMIVIIKLYGIYTNACPHTRTQTHTQWYGNSQTCRTLSNKSTECVINSN